MTEEILAYFEGKLFNDKEIQKRIRFVREKQLTPDNWDINFDGEEVSVMQLLDEIQAEGWSMKHRRKFEYFLETLPERMMVAMQNLDALFFQMMMNKQDVATYFKLLKREKENAMSTVEKLEKELERAEQRVDSIVAELQAREYENNARAMQILTDKLEQIAGTKDAKKEAKKENKKEF